MALRDAFAAAHTHSNTQEQGHAKSLAEAQQRSDGPSKQLMQETAQQRQALQQEQTRIASQLKFAERRIATFEEALLEAQREVAHERDQRQAAVGEANALKAINASQRSQLDDFVRAALAATTRAKTAGPATVSRAMTTVASLYEYWHETGYLIANPAAKLVTGSQKRTEYSPQRFLPPVLVTACDTWALAMVEQNDDITLLRRRAVWALYRFSGVRLAELAWSQDTGLPRIEVEAPDRWTFHVHGKRDKLRSIPLPMACVQQVLAYRIARGLPGEPGATENLPLIHGIKGGSLQESGLFDEVKSLFCEVAKQLEHQNPVQAALLRAASPHWLRHTYAKSLVVDHKSTSRFGAVL